MPCLNCNSNHPDEQCPTLLRFTIDDTYLVPSCGGSPLEPIDLQPLVTAAETDTRLQIDADEKALVYTGEVATNDSEASPDTLPIADMLELMAIKDLGDVDYVVSSNGDLLVYNSETEKWESYTVPSGTIASVVGVDADGNLVKESGAPEFAAPDTVPLGGVIIWSAPVNDIPVSYRQCNGQALDRTVYDDLFDLIGTTYGSGDGSTSFNIPDLRTRVPVGLSTSDTQFDTIGETGGSKTHQLSEAELASHDHGIDSIYSFTPTDGGSVGSDASIRVGANANRTAAQVQGGPTSTGDAGSSTPHNNLQPYIVMPYIMRVL